MSFSGERWLLGIGSALCGERWLLVIGGFRFERWTLEEERKGGREGEGHGRRRRWLVTGNRSCNDAGGGGDRVDKEKDRVAGSAWAPTARRLGRACGDMAKRGCFDCNRIQLCASDQPKALAGE